MIFCRVVDVSTLSGVHSDKNDDDDHNYDDDGSDDDISAVAA